MRPVQFLFLVLVFRSVVCSSKKNSDDILDDGQFQSVLQFLPTFYKAISVLSSANPIIRPALARTLMKIYFKTDEDQNLESGIKNLLPSLDDFATKIVNLENVNESSNASLNKVTSVKHNNMKPHISSSKLKSEEFSNANKHEYETSIKERSKDKETINNTDKNYKHTSDLSKYEHNDDDHHNVNIDDDDFVDKDDDTHYEYYYDYEYMENSMAHGTNSPNSNISSSSNHGIKHMTPVNIPGTHTVVRKTTVVANSMKVKNISNDNIQNQNSVSNTTQKARGEINRSIPNSEIKILKRYKAQQAVETLSTSNDQKEMMTNKLKLNLTDSNVYKSESNQGINMEIKIASQNPLVDFNLMPRRNMHNSDKNHVGMTMTNDDVPLVNIKLPKIKVNLPDLKSIITMNGDIEKKKKKALNFIVYRTGENNFDSVLGLIGQPIVVT